MRRRLPALAGRLTRWWVAFYSSGLPTPVRDGRRAELDSDLWEHQQDALDRGQRSLFTATAILARLARGMPADLSWRVRARRAKGTTLAAPPPPHRGGRRCWRSRRPRWP